MPNRDDNKPWKELEGLLRQGERETLQTYLDGMNPSEIARAISRLGDEEQASLLTLLEPEDAADLIEELPETQGADLIEDLAIEHAVAIVDEMESDHRADVLGEMDKGDAEAIIQEMASEDAEEVRQLLEHDSDTAGGIMVTEFVVYPQDLTVGDVINDLRTNAEAYADYGVQYAYVSSPHNTLVGVLRLRDLILSSNDVPIQKVMIVNPISVLTETPLEELEQTFDRYNFSGLPVIAPEGNIVGVVQRADTEEALSNRAERTFMRFSGIIGGEELRTEPVLSRASKRLSWLSVNLLLSLIAASVIIFFQDIVEKNIALAALIPVLSNISGCSGNQAIAVSIRELTLGLVTHEDVFRVMRMEVVVGIINGIVLAALLSGFVLLWKGDVMLGLVVGLALSVNSVISVVMGGTIPLMLRKANIDPAAAAAPFLTTVSDMCGFFLALSLASALLL
jgi:magnesium transporter